MNASKIERFLKKGILVSPEIADELDQLDESLAEQIVSGGIVVIDKKKIEALKKKDVRVITSYNKKPGKRTFSDFVKYFNKRYKAIEKLLRTRAELDRLTSIQRVVAKKEREKVSVIGIVFDKAETKNGNLIFELEDPTGTIKVIVLKNKDIYSEARDIVLDEVIGINGTSGDKVIFAESIVFPGIPLGKEMKKGVEENYAVFISDVEVGSKNFLKEDFEKFLVWLKLLFSFYLLLQYHQKLSVLLEIHLVGLIHQLFLG